MSTTPISAYVSNLRIPQQAADAVREGLSPAQWAAAEARAAIEQGLTWDDRSPIDPDELERELLTALCRHAQRAMESDRTERWVAWALGRVAVTSTNVRPATGGSGECDGSPEQADVVWIGGEGDDEPATIAEYLRECPHKRNERTKAAVVKIHNGGTAEPWERDGTLCLLEAIDYRTIAAANTLARYERTASADLGNLAPERVLVMAEAEAKGRELAEMARTIPHGASAAKDEERKQLMEQSDRQDRIAREWAQLTSEALRSGRIIRWHRAWCCACVAVKIGTEGHWYCWSSPGRAMFSTR